MRTLLLLPLLLACEKPTPPPLKLQPIPTPAPVEIAKPEPPKPPQKPVVPEPEPDPPGTLYSWEDERGGLHMTQSPPPPGAKLRSKERPRAPTYAPKRTGEAEPPTKEMAELIADEINTFRKDPVQKAKALSGPARQALLAGRRSYVSLKWSDTLAVLAQTRSANSKYARDLAMPERSVGSFTFKGASVEDLLATKPISSAILDADKRYIGGHCQRSLCTFILTNARPK